MRITSRDVMVSRGIEIFEKITQRDIEDAHGGRSQTVIAPEMPDDIYGQIIAAVESRRDENER
jgi:hypothetical protein